MMIFVARKTISDLGSSQHLIAIVLLLCVSCSGLRCRLPQDWSGKYFEGGTGDVIIRGQMISTKGTCVEHSRGYYLFDNRKKSCFQCVFFIHRHHNILQYKESFCVAPESLKKVCALIRSEAQLVTLVREPYVPATCPMEGAFFFSYNDLTYGFCARPESYARPCSNGTVYRFQFRHCVPQASLSGTDVVIECVATWIDGQEKYLYGRMIGIRSQATGNSKDDAYRCFKYETSAEEVRLAMSADATCRGLRSFKDGALVAELTRDSFAWPTPSCMFPDWLSGVTWRDGDGTLLFSLDDSGEALREFQRRPGSGSGSRRLHYPTAVFRCIRILDYYRLEEEFIFLTFSSLHCHSQLQCVKLRRRANEVIEFYAGSLIEHGYEGQCLSDNEFNFMRTLISDGQPLTSCPRSGLYHTALRGGCTHRLDVGCHNNSIIFIETTCAGQTTTGVYLDCLVTWSKNDKSYVIARDQDTDTLTCFSIPSDNMSSSPLIGVDESCNGNLNARNSYSRQTSSSYDIVRNEYCSTAVVDLLPVMRSGTQKTPATSNGGSTSSNYFTNLDLDYDLDYDLGDYDTEEVDSLAETTTPSPSDDDVIQDGNHGHGHLAARKDVLFTTHASNINDDDSPLGRDFGVVSDDKGSSDGASVELERYEKSGFRTESRRFGTSVRRILTGGVGGMYVRVGRELTGCLVLLELIR